MATTIIPIEYIVKTPGMLGGDPRIAGRRIGVHDIVILHLHLGAPLSEIADNYNLSLAEIHAALAYYYDHRAEIEAIIAEEDAAAERLTQPPSEEERAKFNAHMKSPERQMTPPEIAAEFGVSEQAVRKAASEGWIPARKAGKVWLIRRRDAAARWGKGK